MEDLFVTKNGRYVIGFDRIIDHETGFYTEMDNPNPLFVTEMFKNSFLFKNKNELNESIKILSDMRKLIYGFISFNRDLVMEYELKIGSKLLLEHKNSLLVEQNIIDSWDYVKTKILEINPFALQEGISVIEEGVWSWIKDKASAATDWVVDKGKKIASATGLDKAWDAVKSGASWAWDKIKEGAAWVINKGLPWIMEKVENALISPVGIGVDVALSALGIGKLATGVVWGILFVWKIYQIASGKKPMNDPWTWVDLAATGAGILFSGAAKGIKTAFKAAGGNIAKMGGKVLQPILNFLSKGLSWLTNAVMKPIEWIVGMFGSKASAMISSFRSSITKFFDKMKNVFSPAAGTTAAGGAKQGFTQTVKKGIKKDIVDPTRAALAGKGPVTLGAAARKGTLHGLAWHGGMTALEKGVQSYYGVTGAGNESDPAAAKAQAEDDITNSMGGVADDAVSDIIRQEQGK